MELNLLDLLSAHVAADDDIPWAMREIDGVGVVGVRMLRWFRSSGVLVSMARFPGGVTLGKHLHLGSVHAFTVQGRWRYLEYDWVAGPGSYVFEAAGTAHTLATVGDEDVIGFYVTEGGLIHLGPNDECLAHEDAAASVAAYRAGLEAQGLRYPADRIEA